MRILISNLYMGGPGGTQTWVKTMYSELSKHHDVYLHTDGSSAFAPEIPRFDPSLSYDIGLLNHHQLYRELRKADVQVRIVTVHGIFPYEERPAPWADAYVSVAEDIQEILPFASTIIRNPIDANVFRTQQPRSPQLRKLLMSSNYQGESLEVVREAAALVGAELRVIGKGNPTWDPKPHLEWADVVIGKGRTLLEGMAMERGVFCLDYVGGEGWVTSDNVFELRWSNFSGTQRRFWYTPSELASELRKYTAHGVLRPYVKAHHSPDDVAEQYLSLASEVRRSRFRRVRHSVNSAVLRADRRLSSPRVAQLIGGRRDYLRIPGELRRRAGEFHYLP